MKVKGNRVIAYGVKEHAPGDVIEMDDTHAKLNIVNGRVSRVVDAPRDNPAIAPIFDGFRMPPSDKPQLRRV
jgi:hypothetical protein